MMLYCQRPPVVVIPGEDPGSKVQRIDGRVCQGFTAKPLKGSAKKLAVRSVSCES
jgi:hypothetical protein